MGYGEYGGGGSVKWKVEHEAHSNSGAADNKVTPDAAGGKKCSGFDPIPASEMGVGKGAPAGHFRVEVMYNSSADADAARKSAAVQGSSLVLFVKANSGAAHTPQIRVSW
jgi:hypothetical protein